MTHTPAVIRGKRDGASSKRRFTVVFEGDLGEISGNPFHVLSRFGKPVAIAVGDALDTLDKQEMTRAQKTQKLMDDALEAMRRT